MPIAVSRPLPWQPETKAHIMARFRKALVPVYNLEVAEPQSPGQDRRHVFDFEIGIRMIVSVERWSEANPRIHFSFGRNPWGQRVIDRDTFEMYVLELLAGFVAGKAPIEQFHTSKAFHYFYLI